MEICVSGYIVTGVISFIVLMIGITIKYIFKSVEFSRSLKRADEEITCLRNKIPSLDNVVEDGPNESIPHLDESESPLSPVLEERLDHTKEEILVFLALNKNSNIYEVSLHINLEDNVTNHHLEILKNKHLAFDYFRNKTWNISPKGHDYLFKYKLIN